MKKALALLLAVLMLATLLAGCGGNTNPETPAADTSAADGEPAAINFDEEPYEVSIQFVGLFEENKDIANVEAALSAITKE